MADSLPLRFSLFIGLLALTLLIYFPIANSSEGRYSIFKLATGSSSTKEKAPDAPKNRLRLTRTEVPNLSRLNDEYTKVFSHVLPAVVSIDTTEIRGDVVGTRDENGNFQPTKLLPNRALPVLGSGVFVAEDGHILTNYHVVAGIDTVLIRTKEGRQYEAVLVGADSTVDLAVLKVKGAVDEKFPVLNFSNSQRVRPGEIVFAFGNPFGLSESISQGIVNGTGRRFVGREENAYIQTDAVINPGNSGGPLVNIYGEVIGINVISYSGGGASPTIRDLQTWQGIGLALPSNRVVQAYEEIMDLGDRVRPYLGVLFNEVTPNVADMVGLQEAAGALIYSIEHDSPVQGVLKTGDVILKMGDLPIDNLEGARGVIRKQSLEEPVKVDIWREREQQVVEVRLTRFNDVNQIARLPDHFREVQTAEEQREQMGLLLRELTSLDRLTTGMPKDLGAIFVWEVSKTSPLNGHVQAFDVIHEVNGEQIWTEDQFYQLLSQIPPGANSELVLTRSRRRYYLEFRAK